MKQSKFIVGDVNRFRVYAHIHRWTHTIMWKKSGGHSSLTMTWQIFLKGCLKVIWGAWGGVSTTWNRLRDIYINIWVITMSCLGIKWLSTFTVDWQVPLHFFLRSAQKLWTMQDILTLSPGLLTPTAHIPWQTDSVRRRHHLRQVRKVAEDRQEYNIPTDTQTGS